MDISEKMNKIEKNDTIEKLNKIDEFDKWSNKTDL